MLLIAVVVIIGRAFNGTCPSPSMKKADNTAIAMLSLTAPSTATEPPVVLVHPILLEAALPLDMLSLG